MTSIVDAIVKELATGAIIRFLGQGEDNQLALSIFQPPTSLLSVDRKRAFIFSFERQVAALSCVIGLMVLFGCSTSDVSGVNPEMTPLSVSSSVVSSSLLSTTTSSVASTAPLLSSSSSSAKSQTTPSTTSSMVASSSPVLLAPTGGPKSPSCGIYEVTQAEVIAGQQFSKGKYQINTFGITCDEVMGDSGLFSQFLKLDNNAELPKPWSYLEGAVGAPKFVSAPAVGFRVQRISD